VLYELVNRKDFWVNINQNSVISAKPVTLAFWSVKSLIFQFAMVTAAALLPALAHTIGAPVRFLLPMHWPVLLAGLTYGWRAGALVGLAAPLVAFSLSGYPLPPMIAPMTIELATYGFLAGFLCERLKFGRFASLAISFVAGRLAFLAVVIALGSVVLNSQYFKAALLPGLIAAVAQIALLPLVASWWVKKSGE
jgi:niacin transporter